VFKKSKIPETKVNKEKDTQKGQGLAGKI